MPLVGARRAQRRPQRARLARADPGPARRGGSHLSALTPDRAGPPGRLRPRARRSAARPRRAPWMLLAPRPGRRPGRAAAHRLPRGPHRGGGARPRRSTSSLRERTLTLVGRSLALAGTVTAAQPRHRRRAGVPGHPHRPPGAAAARRAGGAAARDPELCRGLRVDLGGARPSAGSAARCSCSPPAATPTSTSRSLAAMRRVDPAVEEVARSLGRSAVAHLLDGDRSPGAAGRRVGRPARRALHAQRLRGGVDPALRRLHPGHLHLLPLELRPHAGRGPLAAAGGHHGRHHAWARRGRGGAASAPGSVAGCRAARQPVRLGAAAVAGRPAQPRWPCWRRPRLPDRLAALLVRHRPVRGHRRRPPARAAQPAPVWLVAAGSDRQHALAVPVGVLARALPRPVHVVHRAGRVSPGTPCPASSSRWPWSSSACACGPADLPAARRCS